MVLDHVIALPAAAEAIADATERTVRWADRCRQAHRRADQALFAIVQGGLDIDLRLGCTHRLAEMDFDGYAIGGLSVGETPEEMHQVLLHTAGALPSAKPRYLMGVGRPQDLLAAIRHGIDMFDCVLPTRNGRNAMAFTDSGTLRLRNLRHERDARPLEEHCPCAACRHSRGYLRHLFMAGEMLGPILLTIHNLSYYQRLMADARGAIQHRRYAEFHAEKLRGWERAAELS
jgi:queuine tRNA-ribosyltransferase